MMESAYLSATEEQRARYLNLLKTFASLSRLFSASKKPYLDYRTAENCFIKAFGAEDLTRSCLAVDVVFKGIGVGIKTFVDTPFQKIAEVDKESRELNGVAKHDAVVASKVRNNRIDAVRDGFGIQKYIYHYTVRREGEVSVHECPMLYIDINHIRILKDSGRSFDFTDGHCNYRFSRSKNTLYKEFDLKNPLAVFGVTLVEDAVESLEESFSVHTKTEPPKADVESIVLPLYSVKGDVRYVPKKSGLNQWNAGGRVRDPDEVYIPFPKRLRDMYPDFFPGRDTSFRLFLPNGKELSAKVCQDQGKAIMSDPNSALGEWLLRDVLKLPKWEEATIETLDRAEVYAVIFHKHPGYYRIYPVRIGDKIQGADGEVLRIG